MASRRYAQIRGRKAKERIDDSKLPFQLRLFRRVLNNETMLNIIMFNFEPFVAGKEKPIWFDAAVQVKLSRGRTKVGVIDLMYYKMTDKYAKARTKRKREWASKRGRPYLELTLDRMQEKLRIWCVKVKAEYDV